MSMRDQLLRRLAELSLDVTGAVPPHLRGAAVDNLTTVFVAELSRLYGGGKLELSTPKVPPATRAQRNRRILDALEAGEPAATIARREQVSVRLVRWLRQKRRVEIAAPVAEDQRRR